MNETETIRTTATHLEVERRPTALELQNAGIDLLDALMCVVNDATDLRDRCTRLATIDRKVQAWSVELAEDAARAYDATLRLMRMLRSAGLLSVTYQTGG
jgi:biopolymer transport protein ExbD